MVHVGYAPIQVYTRSSGWLWFAAVCMYVEHCEPIEPFDFCIASMVIVFMVAKCIHLIIYTFLLSWIWKQAFYTVDYYHHCAYL